MRNLHFRELEEIEMFQALREGVNRINPYNLKECDEYMNNVEEQCAIGIISSDMSQYLAGVLCGRMH